MVSLRLWQCWKLSVTGVGRYESIEKVGHSSSTLRALTRVWARSERSIQDDS